MINYDIMIMISLINVSGCGINIAVHLCGRRLAILLRQEINIQQGEVSV